MKPRYHVVTVYEGHCPTCGHYQNGSFPEYVDKECSECKHNKVKESLVNKDINIYDIVGNEIAGFRILIETKGKVFTIKAKDFMEGIE